MRFVSANVDGVVHHAMIDTLDADILEAVVTEDPKLLPVRLLCETHQHGFPDHGPGSINRRNCSTKKATCPECAFLHGIYKR